MTGVAFIYLLKCCVVDHIFAELKYWLFVGLLLVLLIWWSEAAILFERINMYLFELWWRLLWLLHKLHRILCGEEQKWSKVSNPIYVTVSVDDRCGFCLLINVLHCRPNACKVAVKNVLPCFCMHWLQFHSRLQFDCFIVCKTDVLSLFCLHHQLLTLSALISQHITTCPLC